MGSPLHDALHAHCFDILKEPQIAVALSGGPDSLALLHALSSMDGDRAIHALIVDHGLRAESGEEANAVQEQVQDWPSIQASILTWQHDGVDSKIQESARQARYDLIAMTTALRICSWRITKMTRRRRSCFAWRRVAVWTGFVGCNRVRVSTNLSR